MPQNCDILLDCNSNLKASHSSHSSTSRKKQNRLLSWVLHVCRIKSQLFNLNIISTFLYPYYLPSQIHFSFPKPSFMPLECPLQLYPLKESNQSFKNLVEVPFHLNQALKGSAERPLLNQTANSAHLPPHISTLDVYYPKRWLAT